MELSAVSPPIISSAGPTNAKHGEKLKDVGRLTREDFDGGPVSLDEIEPGLYLGNLTAATHMETLRSFKITHILTLDSVPLPQHIVEASFLTTKYVHIADMAKEDILHHLDRCVQFITDALQSGGNVLVHCYFGVSRSSTAIIAYVMKRHQLDYQQAFDVVKAKRRFVQPNSGFMAQLKLYKRMGYRIDPKYQKYKIYCLRLAGEQLRRAKILPQNFHNLIKPDPGITQENPEPIVYRCRKCRRVLASKSYQLSHQHKGEGGQQQQQQQPPQAQSTKISGVVDAAAAASGTTTGTRLLEQISAQIRKASLGTPNTNDDGGGAGAAFIGQAPTTVTCQSMVFVEPIAWMKNILHNTQGRLNCPKCEQKLGNFSWINGCQCPCGEVVSPAFYLIPSKVELSKTVQNVQTTL